MIKVRVDLRAVAERVVALFPSGAPGLTRDQIEAAIALHAREQTFSDEDYTRLLRLRSQAFKSPDKMINLLK